MHDALLLSVFALHCSFSANPIGVRAFDAEQFYCVLMYHQWPLYKRIILAVFNNHPTQDRVLSDTQGWTQEAL